jgi:hypothetical protein
MVLLTDGLHSDYIEKFKKEIAQPRVHMSLGTAAARRAPFSSVFLHLSIFQVDGFAVPATAPLPCEEHTGLTQAVSPSTSHREYYFHHSNQVQAIP